MRRPAYRCRACGKRSVNAVVRWIGGGEMIICPRCAIVHGRPDAKSKEIRPR